MRGRKDVKVTLFDISSKFTLFWGHNGVETGVKIRKKSAHLPINHGMNV